MTEPSKLVEKAIGRPSATWNSVEQRAMSFPVISPTLMAHGLRHYFVYAWLHTWFHRACWKRAFGRLPAVVHHSSTVFHTGGRSWVWYPTWSLFFFFNFFFYQVTFSFFLFQIFYFFLSGHFFFLLFQILFFLPGHFFFFFFIFFYQTNS